MKFSVFLLIVFLNGWCLSSKEIFSADCSQVCIFFIQTDLGWGEIFLMYYSHTLQLLMVCQGCTNFQKSRSHHKILSARRSQYWEFTIIRHHTLATPVLWYPGFVHPCSMMSWNVKCSAVIILIMKSHDFVRDMLSEGSHKNESYCTVKLSWLLEAWHGKECSLFVSKLWCWPLFYPLWGPSHAAGLLLCRYYRTYMHN